MLYSGLFIEENETLHVHLHRFFNQNEHYTNLGPCTHTFIVENYGYLAINRFDYVILFRKVQWKSCVTFQSVSLSFVPQSLCFSGDLLVPLYALFSLMESLSMY